MTKATEDMANRLVGPTANALVGASTPLATPPPNRRLRAAMVGLGKQGSEDHLPALAASPSVELVAVCDADDKAVARMEAEYRVPGYTDVVELLEAADLDFVVVAVPHHAGRDVVLAAAAHGVHVLKEKPLATSLDEAREIAEACDAAGVELMVTLQRRFNPVYTSFPQLYDQIGEPFVFDASYTMAVDPASGWRGSTELAGGGCIIDMGYHIIDTLLWYFGMPDQVLAQTAAVARPELDYDAEDTAVLHLSYDSGMFGTVLLSRCIAPKTEVIRAVGTRGSVVLERGRIQRLDNDGTAVESLARENAWPSAAAAQLDHFRRVLTGQRPNVSGAAAHLAHAAVVTAAYASAASGQMVNPKELIA
jgi:predicted dehydrogenase